MPAPTRPSTLRQEALLDQAARACPRDPTLESLTRARLVEITRQHGVDLATALLFDRFRSSPRHARFIRKIDALRQTPPASPPQLDTTVVIVPGALYRERPDMGGDGHVVRHVAARFGLNTDLIPLDSFGPVHANAVRILDWMAAHAAERIILVSLSKGGADLKRALTLDSAPERLRNVIAWINVCGPLHGSPMANWILGHRVRAAFIRWKFRWQRRDFQFVTDLRHGGDGPLSAPINLPSSIGMVTLLGFPLRKHLTTHFSRLCHRIIAAAHGPNDGTTPLADLRTMPGEVYPAWGMDHYFRPETGARSLVAATLHHLADTCPRAGRRPGQQPPS